MELPTRGFLESKWLSRYIIFNQLPGRPLLKVHGFAWRCTADSR